MPLRTIDNLAGDIRFAGRQLRRHASFTTAAILMLRSASAPASRPSRSSTRR